MNRALRLLAAGLLVGLIPVSASGCGPCCAVAPENDWNVAASLASPVTGSGRRSLSMFTVIGDNWYFESRGESAIAIVDQHEVVEAVFETRMPDTDSLTVDSAGARSAAERYMEEAGYVASGDLGRYRESTKVGHQAGVALIDVTFSPPDAALTPLPGAVGAQGWWHDLEVLVNGSSGQVFALVDHANAWGREVFAPVVGMGRDAELAQSVASRPGLVVVSAELYFSPSSLPRANLRTG